MGNKNTTAAPRPAVMTAPAASNDLLADLREIYKNLDAVDTRPMSPADQEQWFNQYTTTRQAIMVMETNTLAEINAKLGDLADDVTRAIDDCEKALHGIQEGAVIIQTVATAFGAIAQIAALLA
jgi:hypothetical protein